MSGIDTIEKLEILAAAAKYDASCAPSGTAKKHSLGASAARGMLGKTVSISKARGQPHALEDGSELWITAHPSYLLRLDGAARDGQERLFRADLAALAERLAELSS